MHALSKPCLGTFNCTSSLTAKRAKMHGRDTLPLHGKHHSAMNKQKESVSKQLHVNFLKESAGEK
jgi:hypothetical protein